jgi:hypothetical protein
MEENTQTTLTDEQLVAAKQEIEAVLQKYNIVLIPITIHHGDRTFSRIDVAPAPSQEQAVKSVE